MRSFDPVGCPIYITCRDRVTDLRRLVGWLEAAGHERIILVDNDSLWEPLLQYLDDSPHEVLRLGQNYGSRAVWHADLYPRDEWFVVTDPDIIPMAACPMDAVAHFHRLLQRYPDHLKAGFGLYVNDMPPELSEVVRHERSILLDEPEPGVFESLIDTTFALHRPGTDYRYEALRTGHPYLARHMGWYAEVDPSEEDRFYLERATRGFLGSSWAERALGEAA